MSELSIKKTILCVVFDVYVSLKKTTTTIDTTSVEWICGAGNFTRADPLQCILFLHRHLKLLFVILRNTSGNCVCLIQVFC